jgi:hypothetical protein
VSGAEVGKTGMESGAVIEGFNRIEDGCARLGGGGEAMVVDELIFKTAPEGLDESIVVTVAGPAHGSDQAVLGENRAVGGAGECQGGVPRGQSEECHGVSPCMLTFFQGVPCPLSLNPMSRSTD